MIEKLAGPIIGALIGYCTNYIAVKMLFYPKKEIRIGGKKLPFTPGAIPKGKSRLARAIGKIVADELLTEEDIKRKMISPETEKAVVDQLIQGLSVDLRTCISCVCPSEEKYHAQKTKLIGELSDQIMDSVDRLQLDELIVREAEKAVKEKIKGSMLAMFVNDEMLNTLIQPVGEKVAEYISDRGPAYIQSEVESRIDALEERSVMELCSHMDITEAAVRETIASVYHRAIDTMIGRMIGSLDISGIIEEKINAMSVDSLEDMVLTVMKKELDMIVNLGALVGAVLGILNIFL